MTDYQDMTVKLHQVSMDHLILFKSDRLTKDYLLGFKYPVTNTCRLPQW